jgi:hypothetical protein
MPELDLRDICIGIGLGAGLTGEETAEFADCSRSTVYDRRKVNGDLIDTIANKVRSATAALLASATARIKRRYEEMYEKAVGVVDLTLDSFDPKLAFQAATRVIDQVEGKPTQRIESKIESHSTSTLELVAIPSADMQFLLESLRGTRAVLTGGPPRDFIEGELVQPTSAEPSSEDRGDPAAS